MCSFKKIVVYCLAILSLAAILFSANMLTPMSSVHASMVAHPITGTSVVANRKITPNDPGSNSCGPGGTVEFDQQYQIIWYRGAGLCDSTVSEIIDAVGVQELNSSWHYVHGPFSKKCTNCSAVYNPPPPSSYAYGVTNGSNYRVVETGSYTINGKTSSYGEVIWQLY